MRSDTATDSGSVRSTLIDIANCIGCRACQVACKQWNEKDGEPTELGYEMGFQNPAALSAKTLTLIKFHEMVNHGEAGRRGIGLRHAALPPLPPAGLCLRVPDDGALPAERRSGVLQHRRLHRLPLLHAGVSLGRADRRMELALPEDLEVHALRRPCASAAAGRIQRAAAL